ncbi:MFS transporter, partial [Pseudomonas aeruginosa]
TLAARFCAAFGLQSTFIIMSLIGLVGVGLALWLWPARDSSDIAHDHPDLSTDHPHLREHADRGGHRHPMIVDGLHRYWARI